MAPRSSQPPHVELWTGIGIAKPEPLRIIKRAKTVAVRGSSGEIPIPRRRSSRSTDGSGSPPDGPEMPLTIRKKRRGRGSILNGRFDLDDSQSESDAWSSSQHSSASNVFQGADDTTPKATRSACLRNNSNYPDSSSDISIDLEYTPRAGPQPRVLRKSAGRLERHTPSSLSFNDPFASSFCTDSEIPRRLSRSKTLFNKAFGSLRRPLTTSLNSKSSEDSLQGRVSLKSYSQPLAKSQTVQSLRSSSSRLSLQDVNGDTVIFQANSISSSNSGIDTPTPSCILYPQIRITPEVESVEIHGKSDLWVAVTVTGVLINTLDPIDCALRKGSMMSGSGQGYADTTDYGCLYDIEIKLGACSSRIVDIVGELSLSRTLRLGETELLLAQVSLDDFPNRSGHVRQSSDELIDELQGKLGQSTSDYLTVFVSCRPSMLPNYRGPEVAPKGMSSYRTSITAEAHATIKRHSSASAWTRPKSIFNSEANRDNPVVDLIHLHYHHSEAQDIMRAIQSTPDEMPSVYRRVLGSDRAWASSSETVIPINGKYEIDNDLIPRHPPPKSSIDITEAYAGRPDASREPLTPRVSEEIDPARQIWSQMRQVSRSSHKSNKNLTSSLETSHRDELLANIEKQQAQDLKNEQTRIMHIALRNKRSIGADTLRSMATPSTKMGLGTGKNVWGWLW